ncbi:type IV pilus secretin PilQ [Ramlibacter sp. Leaf400]|uniref:type IV pilus secretin PilQ n=1 Tax=Ramlibacter sp. Leaf400 TaxID=1736365 RepID=UPI0006F24CF7|nr:type IV pilus secretin PilQ [Ramlibacter sp. Leaf400]KQT09464.1 secretin [Ramlibacter sp. Leaf400]
MKNQKTMAGRLLLGCLGGLLALGVSLSARAQTVVQNVSSSVQGGVEVVRIDFSQPLAAVPPGFTIQAPARIALDVPNATNGLGRSSIELNQGNLRSVNVVTAGDRTRLVLNLRAATGYKAQIEGKSLLVSLEPVAVASATPSPAQSAFAESRNRDTQPIKDLDFRRGPDAAGRVQVELPSNQVGVDIKQQGQQLVVEFLKSTLPEGLRRRLDVSDFGTPVQTVTTSQAGDRVRVVIEPKGQWEHSAYQSDNQFVVEVRPLRVDPNKLSQGPGYTGEKLSLNFQNIEVRSLLQVIADFTNFNIVTSDSVSGAVTLRLKDVPWDQALDIILQAKGLGMRKSGNVLWIAPKDEIAAKEKLELESRAAIQSLEPLRTQSFQLNYTKSADIAAQITAGAGAARILSARGSVIAEGRTNQIFVTDIPSRLEAVQSLISQLDIAVPQVLIEARIVEASDTFGKSLGVRLGGRPFTLNGSRNTQFGPTYITPDVPAGGTAVLGDNVGTTAGDFVNLPSAGVGGFTPASFAVSLFESRLTRLLNLEISALEADGKGKLVSSPRIVTADKTKALIEQGTEFPYQQATSSGATSVAFRRATLKLEVTPQITPEGNIILDLDISKDSRGETTAAGIAINTKHIRTQVLVDNGGTVVIGGIFELAETETESRVPVLGELPGVGVLFRNRQRTANKQEMLVFITPKMIADRSAAR